MINNVKYIHEETIHNLKDPKIIVPYIYEIFKPNSVVDLGCGLGTFLYVFKEHGVKTILGLDGKWVDKEKLFRNIPKECFYEIDIEEGLKIDNKFDLALCLEVLEHVDEKYADQAIEVLTNLSDRIVFSAAIPGQGGQNHVNEQWIEYWRFKFNEKGFEIYDIFRPYFWNNKELAVWYKQNLFLFVKKNTDFDISKIQKQTNSSINDYIHPNLFTQKTIDINELTTQKSKLSDEISKIKNGEKPLRFYLKLLLKHTRSFFNY